MVESVSFRGPEVKPHLATEQRGRVSTDDPNRLLETTNILFPTEDDPQTGSQASSSQDPLLFHGCLLMILQWLNIRS